MTLLEYIGKYYNGNKAAFAKDNSIHRQQVNKWVNGNYTVQGSLKKGFTLHNETRQLVKPKR